MFRLNSVAAILDVGARRDAGPVLFEVELVAWLASLGLGPLHPGVIPEAGRTGAPAIVWSIVTESPELNLDGSSGLYVATVQFDFYAAGAVAVAALAERFRLAVEDYSGPIGRMVADEITIGDWVSSLDSFTVAGNSRPVRRKMCECEFRFYRAVVER